MAGVNRDNTLGNCEIYNELQAGKALANFLVHVNTIKSNIGNYKESKFSGKRLIVSGIQIFKNADPVYLLADTNIGIDISDKFKEFNGKKAITLLKDVLVSNVYRDGILNKYKAINSNAELILPFLPGEESIINTTLKDRQIENMQSTVSNLTWSIDKETSKLNGYVAVHINAAELTKTYKIPLEEYGNEFKIVKNLVNNTKLDTKLISMTRFGYIKPIEIEEGNIKIALDGSNLYYVEKDIAYIIGSWKKDINGYNIVETPFVSSITKSKAYIKIKNNINYIEKHLGLIAPYKLVESNVIKM